MGEFDELVNWNVLFENSESFKNAKPFKHAYIKGFFKNNFYKKLYDTFPKFDETWFVNNDYRRSAKTLYLQSKGEHTNPKLLSNVSPEWNKFKELINSDEFLQNFSKFIGESFSNVYESGFFANAKSDFQLPHIDMDGEYEQKIQFMFYFTKNWEKGDPGGTYLCETDDESTIFFEPYDLDNTLVCFEETPKSWHGTRYITKNNVVRQAAGLSLM